MLAFCCSNRDKDDDIMLNEDDQALKDSDVLAGHPHLLDL